MALLASIILSLTASVLAETYAKTTTFTFAGNAVPTGLAVSNYKLTDSKPKQRQFVPQNVYVSGGYLNLLVNGGQQNDDVIWCGEVQTTFTIKSARVETYAILTEPAGVCNGMFMYLNDNQEIDIEWLSDVNSQSNNDTGAGTRHLFYTNQAVKKGTPATSRAGLPPSDATSAVHNYRIDWNSTASTFYVDDKFQYSLKKNVPQTKKAFWIWNNWSSGDPNWSYGPPATDALFKIQKIVMYYNPGA